MKVPVLLPKIFNYPFTYDSGSIKSLKAGDIVVVPFGREQEIGVVWDKIQPTIKKIKTRKIEKKIENISINEKLIKYINWFSMYNLAPKGLILKMSLIDKKNILENKKSNSKNIETEKKIYILNTEQKKSLDDLKKFGNKFNVSVLQGITGSGKTLVYFERLKEIINNRKQALVLLPEIFLTNQFKDRFQEYFGFEPSIWHSGITQKNKKEIWHGVINKKIKLIIGARSSLLLPFKELGIIVVDEEHDSSYKQNERLIYNARDMAISRASYENVPVHLVTSVPSLETYNNIKNKKYNLTKIKKRFSDFPLPKTKIINLNLLKLKKNEFISNETLSLVQLYLKKKNKYYFF